MSDQTKFDHIKVTPADDDIVIVAGIRSDEDASPAAATSPTSSDERSVAPSGSPDGMNDDEGPARAKAADAADVRDAYHPTTLEDIESTKMPLVQKVIIILAVCGVAAFAIWYIVANGVIA